MQKSQILLKFHVNFADKFAQNWAENVSFNFPFSESFLDAETGVERTDRCTKEKETRRESLRPWSSLDKEESLVCH